MASKKKRKAKQAQIDLGFTLFVHAFLNGKNLEQLDNLIRERIHDKKPYIRLKSSSKNALSDVGKRLGSLAWAVGINRVVLMQTREQSLRDLSRGLGSIGNSDKIIRARLAFKADGNCEGIIACGAEAGPNTKMAMLFDVAASKAESLRVSSAFMQFPVGERAIKFELTSKAEKALCTALIRKFPHYDELERGFRLFAAGDEAVADYLVSKYRETSNAAWRENELSPVEAVRRATFGSETYELRFQDEDDAVSVEAVWGGSFRFSARYGYTDYMELDLASICDVDEYERAVSEREHRRDEEARQQEAARAAEEAARQAEEELKALERRRVVEAKRASLGDRVLDLSSDKPYERPAERVRIGDLVVRATTSTCRYPDHEIHEVIAIVNVFNPAQGVSEVAVDAFCCPKCKRYYILDKTFDRLSRRGSICCKVIVRSGQVQEFVPTNHEELAEQSFFRQIGYSVSKEEGLSDSERRAILDFAIENRFKTQKQTIGFLEWLIRFNGSGANMRDAVRKWESDIKYLMSSRTHGAERVKIDRIFFTKHKW